MKVAMLRIGIDTGSGGIHGPLFKDGSFDYIPIPDISSIDERTYSNTTSLKKQKLIEYFPESKRFKMANQTIHFDPEFVTFTYGDPTSPKAGLRHLNRGDMLIFYCGLEGWNFRSDPALYVIGYFEILLAGKANDFSSQDVHKFFGNNFHVRHSEVFERQRERLVLIRGSEQSRLLKKAVRISVLGNDRNGKPLKILSPEMQKIFGTFDGRLSFQRSPTRWVDSNYVTKAVDYMKSLP